MAVPKRETNRAYHDDTLYCGSSMIRKYRALGPSLYFQRHVDPDAERLSAGDYAAVGSLVHALVLEPHAVDQEFAMVPKGLRRDDRQQPWKDFKAKHPGKVYLKEADWVWARQLAEAIRAHGPTGERLSLIEDSVVAPEMTYRWRWAGNEGLRVKARWDLPIILGDLSRVEILDLKIWSCSYSTELGDQDIAHTTGRRVASYRTDWQQALYAESIRDFIRTNGGPSDANVQSTIVACWHDQRAGVIRPHLAPITHWMPSAHRLVGDTIEELSGRYRRWKEAGGDVSVWDSEADTKPIAATMPGWRAMQGRETFD